MKLKNKKSLIFIILLVFLLIILSIIITYKNIGVIYNALGMNLKNENEQELISIDMQVKKTEGDVSKCFLIFTSNDENEKIKSIEYPEGKNNIINVDNEEGKQKIAIDYDIEKGKEISNFIITTVTGRIIEKTTGYTITYNVDGVDVNSDSFLIGENPKIEKPTKKGYTFYGWVKDKNATVPEYIDEYVYSDSDRDVVLYALWLKNNDAIIQQVANISETGQPSIQVVNEEYTTNCIVYNGDLTLDGTEKNIANVNLSGTTYILGDENQDVATGTTTDDYAKNMVILKVNGDLTINEGITVTACKSANGYGGPKGLLIYCTGTLINNGTISMTARGAYAESQNVYLYKNADETYEYVPAEGCSGGASVGAVGRKYHRRWNPY